MRNYVVLFILLSCTLGVCFAGQDCYWKRAFKGCRVSYGRCICTRQRACENPFPYLTEKECQNDLRGQNDKCSVQPCINGLCVQVNHNGYRDWACQCAGSGYYGIRCEHKCPPKVDPMPANYPSACVMADGIL